MKVKTLVPWFGSNRTLAHTVGEALVGCNWVGVPFAGGMSELLYITARTVVVNDLHRHVINLAKVLAHPTTGPPMYRRLRRLAFHPEQHHESQQWCKQHPDRPHLVPDPEAAFHYFVTSWMGRSAKMGTGHEFNGGPPVRWGATGGDSNTRYRSAVASILGWRRVLARCNFLCLDGFTFLESCQDKPGHGVYCDPPFLDAGDRYKHGFTETQHYQLSLILGEFTKTRVVCRFYDHPMVRELYPAPRWKWMSSTGRNQANAKTHEVLLVAN